MKIGLSLHFLKFLLIAEKKMLSVARTPVCHVPCVLSAILGESANIFLSPSSLETSKGDEESVPSHILKEIGRLEAESSCISNVFFKSGRLLPVMRKAKTETEISNITTTLWVRVQRMMLQDSNLT